MLKEAKANKIILEIAKKRKMAISKVEAIIRSQFEAAKEGAKNKLNSRFPYIGLFYNRNNKNPEYLKMKENERKNK